MAGKKYTHVRAHIRRKPEKREKPEKDISPLQKIVDAEVDSIIKGRRRKIS